MGQMEQLSNTEDYIHGSIEDVQDNVSEKLAKIFSFYNEQEFLDEINNMTQD